MAKDYDTIVQEIDKHLQQSSKQYYSDFYIGITDNVQRRLFEEHNVDKEHSWWIFREANSADIARNVEKHYLNLGMRGGAGGGDDKSIFVYCYAVTPKTNE